MKTKIFGILAFVMVALAGTGIAYGHWYDSANVNATIQTGYISVVLSDDMKPHVWGGCKDCPQSMSTASQSISADNKTISITIDNAYPSICVCGVFNIENQGTVPVEPTDNAICWNITDSDGSSTLNGDIKVSLSGNTAIVCDDNVQIMTITYCMTDSPGNNGNVITSSTICPGQTVYVHYHICFQEGLEQDTTYWIYSTWNFQNCESNFA